MKKIFLISLFLYSCGVETYNSYKSLNKDVIIEVLEPFYKGDSATLILRYNSELKIQKPIIYLPLNSDTLKSYIKTNDFCPKFYYLPLNNLLSNKEIELHSNVNNRDTIIKLKLETTKQLTTFRGH